MSIQIIAPAPYYEERTGKSGYDERYDRLICEKFGYPLELPTNVGFRHDPEWRANLGTWSIQAAHNREGVWKYVEILWLVAALTPPYTVLMP